MKRASLVYICLITYHGSNGSEEERAFHARAAAAVRQAWLGTAWAWAWAWAWVLGLGFWVLGLGGGHPAQ
ncbi:hypothetical protein F2Q69_00052254 [Brassica cretica]|uniref:Uncharacterized protein n=1 Tax=Brassica cretica TaxID=69181 RepID=A0A8S9MXD9_BRACR|nr:hypothetical protein F2Q69_00052254 [Brassica cretica]